MDVIALKKLLKKHLIKRFKLENKKYKEIIKNAKASDFIHWIALIIITVGIPILQLSTGTLTLNGEIINITWWMYMLGIFVWIVNLCVWALVLFLLSLIFSKIAIWINKN